MEREEEVQETINQDNQVVEENEELSESVYDDEDDVEVDVEDDDEEDEDEDDDKIAVDLSENTVYRGLCTLLEDDEGNNLLEYISLLHSELIGHNKTMRVIKKDLGRLANAAESIAKNFSK